MHISKLILKNFRCFGPEPTIIDLADSTCFIGANGSGKTAAFEALGRMFGANSSLRRLTPEDFHVPDGQKRRDQEERELYVEARIELPELKKEDEESSTVAAVFKHMVIEKEATPPYCRIRLTGKLEQVNSITEEVTEKLIWVESADEGPGGEIHEVSSHDRGRINFFYVPASRSTTRELASVSGTLLTELLNSIKWDEALSQGIKDAAEALREKFVSVEAVKLIDKENRLNWSALYDEKIYKTPAMQFIASNFADVFRDAQIVFSPTHAGDSHDVSRLSDGQRSLFYFAFINTLFSVRRRVHQAHHAPKIEGDTEPKITDFIDYGKLRPAPLTILALEEPENHLSPHYLARIMKQAGDLAKQEGAQVLISSHSASIVDRVEPESIRYFRNDLKTSESHVRRLTLPESGTDAAKYIKEAVRAYPELYFARLVILGEGDSEEVVLPRFARCLSGDLDLAFISVVPLGGRFVSHFWRLLNDLEIPHVTLLDLDRERPHGGWRVIQYVFKELVEVLSADDIVELTRITRQPDGRNQLSQEEIEGMNDWDGSNTKNMDAWINRLRRFNVFFSSPLDLDLMMLDAYEQAYKGTAKRGPKGMKGDGRDQRIKQAITTVLGMERDGAGDGATYTPDELALFPWYSNLFFGQGKPTTHTEAWLKINDTERITSMPEPIKVLMDRIKVLVSRAEAEE